jgi:hypothetical protein
MGQLFFLARPVSRPKLSLGISVRTISARQDLGKGRK